MFKWSLVSGAVLVALVTACGAGPASSPAQLQAAQSATLDQSATHGRFSGLKILSIESMPVRCPCFELKAEATNKKGLTSVVIHFERMGDQEMLVQSTEVDGLPLKASERVPLARALAAAGKKAADDAGTVRTVAEDLIKQELD